MITRYRSLLTSIFFFFYCCTSATSIPSPAPAEDERALQEAALEQTRTKKEALPLHCFLLPLPLPPLPTLPPPPPILLYLFCILLGVGMCV